MPDPEPANALSRLSRRLLVLSGAAVLAAIWWSSATRPATNRPTAGSTEGPGSTVATEARTPPTPQPTEERGWLADFFKSAATAPTSVDEIGGRDGGTGPRKAAPKSTEVGGPPPLDPSPYDFGPAARRDSARLAALLADTHARLLDGRWEEHLAKLQAGLKAALLATKADPEGKAYEDLWRSPLFAVGANQALLIARANSTEGFTTRTGPESLRQLTKDEGIGGFLEELLGHADWMEAFLAQVRPEDEASAALKVWALLWNSDPNPLRGKYLHLQVAFALVYDRELTVAQDEGTTINPLIRYAFLRSAAEDGKLKTDVMKLPIDTLVWVVGAEVGESDLHWAHQETKLRHLPAGEWAKAYQIVEQGGTLVKLMTPKNKPSSKNAEAKLSRTAQAKIDAVDVGSLESLFKFGGEAAFFAVNSARAFGIPAAVLASPKVGQATPPTWFSFRREARHWELGVGRPLLGAATGTTTDPQTRATIREFELTALTDRKHEGPEFARSTRLRLLAKLCGQLGEPGRQQACLAAACHAAERSIIAWRERLAALATDDSATTAPWGATLQELRRAFDDSADLRDLADEYEARFILGHVTAGEAVRTIQGHLQKLLREFPARRDLYLAGISRAGRILARDRATNATAISALYREALAECAGDMTEFRGVLADYYATVKGDEKLEQRFLEDAERTFRRKVELDALAFFEMTEELYVYFRKCGHGQQGLRLRKEGEKAKEDALKAALKAAK